MHFALPQRKTSRPPPYAAHKSPRISYASRVRIKQLAVVGSAVCLIFFLFLWLSKQGSGETVPAGTPRVVLVTTFDSTYPQDRKKTILKNREAYSQRHGYGTFFRNSTDYDLSNPVSPPSWAKVPAMRQAMSEFSHSRYFFFLDQDALIMRPELSIEDHIVNPSRLKNLIRTDAPVVPPDSVIHTYKRQDPNQIDLVLTQDHEKLCQGSFVLRSGEWAKYFLDAWFDSLYRSYNFQRAEGHALEHLVQWHGTVLVKLALVPQRVMNGYTKGEGEEVYQDGDFVAAFTGCDRPDSGRACEQEVKPLLERLSTTRD